jgi:hypothetical protein
MSGAPQEFTAQSGGGDGDTTEAPPERTRSTTEITLEGFTLAGMETEVGRRRRRQRIEQEKLEQERRAAEEAAVQRGAADTISNFRRPPESPRREGPARQGGAATDAAGREQSDVPAREGPPRSSPQASESPDRVRSGGLPDSIAGSDLNPMQRDDIPGSETALNIGPGGGAAPFGEPATGQGPLGRSLSRITAGAFQAGNADDVARRDLGDRTPIIGNRRLESFIGDVETGFREQVAEPAGGTFGRGVETFATLATDPGGSLRRVLTGRGDPGTGTAEAAGDVTEGVTTGAIDALNPGSIGTAAQETGETLAFLGGEIARGRGAEATTAVGTEISRLAGGTLLSARRRPAETAGGIIAGTAVGTGIGRVARPRLRSAGEQVADAAADRLPDPEAAVTRQATDRGMFGGSGRLTRSESDTDTGGETAADTRAPDDPDQFGGAFPGQSGDPGFGRFGSGGKRGTGGAAAQPTEGADVVGASNPFLPPKPRTTTPDPTPPSASATGGGVAGAVTQGAQERRERAQTPEARLTGDSPDPADAALTDTVFEGLFDTTGTAAADTPADATGGSGTLLGDSLTGDLPFAGDTTGTVTEPFTGSDTAADSDTLLGVDAGIRTDTDAQTRADTRTSTRTDAGQRERGFTNVLPGVGTPTPPPRSNAEGGGRRSPRLPGLGGPPDDDDRRRGLLSVLREQQFTVPVGSPAEALFGGGGSDTDDSGDGLFSVSFLGGGGRE